MSLETLMVAAVLAPLAGGVLIALTGSRPNLRESVTLLTSAVTLALVASLVPAVLDGARPELILVEMMPELALRFRLEPLGMIYAGVAALLWPVNSLYSIGYMRGNHEKNQTRFYVCFALSISAALGIAFSGNLLTLFAFYEVLTFSTYPLVTHKGSEEAMKAGRVYLGILVTTSVGLLLLGIIWTASVAGTVEFIPGGILEGRVGPGLAGLLLLLYMFGIGKAAIMPVHRWLPAAMVAPTPVSALLHAVAVVKAGVFSVLKVVVYVFGLDFLAGLATTGWLVWAAGFTVVAASVVALRILMAQGNLKRLLAYSTVSQLSYIVLAAALFTSMGATGGTLHIVAHAFGKITLFFAAGAIYTAAHKTEISQLRGVGRRMPWTMGAFAIGALSMIGLPPAGGFVSKWYIMIGAFQAEHAVAFAVLVLSTLLNTAYFVPIVYMAFLQPEAVPAPRPAYAGGGSDHGVDWDHGEAPWPIVAALTVTAALTILLFFFPGIPLALARAVGGAG
jgi:multicomponent Na+:H+ antiporter subunit D